MSQPQVKNKLFRKVALDRLSSPEQLDTMVQIVTLKSWLMVAPLVALVVLAVLWGIFGSIATKVNGNTLLMQRGGLSDITSGSTGRITSMNINVGDTVDVGQIVAILAQPELVANIQSIDDRLAELQRQDKELNSQIGRSKTLADALLAQQRAAVVGQISAAKNRAQVLRKRLISQRSLLEQGLITDRTLLDSQNELASAQLEIENAKSQLQQVSLRRAEDDKRGMQELNVIVNQISETRRTLDGLNVSLQQSSQIKSSYAGRVIEIKASSGTLVTQGAAIATVEPAISGNSEIEAVIYIRAAEGKKIKVGMEAQIVPSTVTREEYGFMIAQVSYVSEYASTEDSMLAILQNRQMVQELSGGEVTIEIRARLLPGDTTSGFKWSSEKGPDFKIGAGTLGSAEIVVHKQAPITLVVPFLKKIMVTN
jgi:HlyD family secretion protein